jgi:hypothetical protein
MVAITLTLLLVALWAVTHCYSGFDRDGALYAVQAVAKIQPPLQADLYLQNTTQDHYTIFSPIYAFFIRIFGLQTGELILFALCQVWFYAAAGRAAREFSSRNAAWLCVALLIITVGHYGAYRVVNYAENYLSARSLAEALVATAIACHFRRWRWQALGIAVIAMFIHPLMALPGLLLLICLRLPVRLAVIAAVGGVMATLVSAFMAVHLPTVSHVLTVMDPAWLEVVRERSQFLFIQYWTPADWKLAARPLVCLTLSAVVLPTERARKLCIAAMLVGVSGLAVTLIAGSIGPVAVLLQGQAWRWMWITGFISVLLVVPTVFHMWRDDRCGPLCALFLVFAWTYPEIDSLVSAGLALMLWLARKHLSERAGYYLKWTAGAVGAIITVWILAHALTYFRGPIPGSGRESLIVGRIREVFGLGISAALFAGLVWFWVNKNRSRNAALVVSLTLLAASVVILPGSVRQLDAAGSRAEVEEFGDWRRAIPPDSSVLILPARNSPAFVWFTLGRASYLTVDQSAGAVFSPITAQEVRRRSAVLLPVSEPDWQLLTHNTEAEAGRRKDGAPKRPLTAESLSSICRDPQLGFVIAKESVGFDPLRHTHAGGFRNWNLYDCRHVRSAVPST